MSESLVRQLVSWLADGPVIVASVVDARGATPRKRHSHMLIRISDEPSATFESVGGGEAESRVIDAARRLLQEGAASSRVRIDLDGSAGAAGICGGHMDILLHRWAGDSDLRCAEALAARLRAGEAVSLHRDAEADGAAHCRVDPDDRLLIIGGGHCGLALHQMARHLDFDLCVFDERVDFANADRFPDTLCLHGTFDMLQQALYTPRRVLAVLLSRDFATDLGALQQLAARPPAFIGMMGSRRRIHQVRTALVERLGDRAAQDLERVHAPIGLDIGAHTPHEIAISVLAELIAWRHASAQAPPA